MKREEIFDDMHQKYTEKMKGEHLKYNEIVKEKSKAGLALRKSQKKVKITLIWGISVMLILAMIPLINVLGATLMTLIPAWGIPMLVAGTSFGVSSIITKVIYKARKWDKKALEYSNAKTEEDKIQDYLENRLEEEKATIRRNVNYQSWEKTYNNMVLFRRFSVDAKQTNSDQEMEQMKQDLLKEKEQLDRLSTRNTLKREIEKDLSERKCMLLYGVMVAITSIGICIPVVTSLSAVIPTAIMTTALYGGYTAYCTSKTKKAIKKILANNNLTEQDLKENIGDSFKKTIDKIVSYEDTIQLNNVLKKVSEFDQNEREESKAKENTHALDSVKIEDSVLEQLTEAPIEDQPGKNLEKTI